MVGGPSGCVLQKSQARAIIGGALMLTGGGVVLVGLLILAAGAFQRTPAARTLEQIAGVPVVGGGVRAVQRTARRPSAQRSRSSDGGSA